MQLSREPNENHSITSYSEKAVTVNGVEYQQSVIISRDIIVSDWPIHSIQELNEALLSPLLQLKPELILIGQHQALPAPIIILEKLSKWRIGLDCMSIGASSRTFNLLLAEGRSVVLGIILR